MLSNMIEIKDLTVQQLLKAAKIKERIADLESELAKLLGAAPVPVPGKNSKPARKKHRMSAAGRARIAAAQKARWAKQKAGKK